MSAPAAAGGSLRFEGLNPNGRPGEEPAWQAPELALGEDWVLVLDGDPDPGDKWPVYSSD